MIKRIKNKIKELLDLIIADCNNCLHRDRCPFKDDNRGSCWERGKGSYYIRNKNK